MGKTVRQKWDRTWRRAEAGIVLKEVGTQTLGMDMDRQKATVSEWVTLRPIYKVCERETVYK